MLFRLIVLCCAAFFAVTMNLGSAAALENENLLVALPKGYKVGHQAKNGKAIITELIPEKEVIANWTEMVTVQIFFGLGHVTPDQFRQGMEKTWSTACPGSQFGVVNKGTERGYPTLTWLQNCPLNKVTRKPEITWLKAIQGRDSLYVVQKAFKFSPTPDQVKTWVAFLQKVSVCDTRLTDRKCPLK